MSHFKAWKAFDTNPNNNWQLMIDATYKIIRDITQLQNPVNGLLPDFAHVNRVTGVWSRVPDGVQWLESANADSQYAFNAMRIPWRLGTDYLLYGDTPIGNTSLLQTCLQPLHNFLMRGFNGNVWDLWTIPGISRLDGSGAAHTGAMCVPPVLVSAAAVGTPTQVEALWQFVMQNRTTDSYSEYYAILSMIAASGNWWTPEKM